MRRIFLLGFVLAAATLHAQSSQAELEARLLHQPLYLRGLWRDDTLKFDRSGSLQGAADTTSFTLSGIEITKVRRETDGLLLDGRRIGLVFDKDVPERVVLRTGNLKMHDEGVHLDIAAPSSGDYGPALSAIFATDLVELVPMLPPEWKKFAAANLQPGYHSKTDSNEKPKPPQGVSRVGGGVTPPKVLFAPEPKFSAEARGLKRGGSCLVYLQVDLEGNPVNLQSFIQLALASTRGRFRL